MEKVGVWKVALCFIILVWLKIKRNLPFSLIELFTLLSSKINNLYWTLSYYLGLFHTDQKWNWTLAYLQNIGLNFIKACYRPFSSESEKYYGSQFSIFHMDHVWLFKIMEVTKERFIFAPQSLTYTSPRCSNFTPPTT
jgi:hypothetical protein